MGQDEVDERSAVRDGHANAGFCDRDTFTAAHVLVRSRGESPEVRRRPTHLHLFDTAIVRELPSA
jgi:hypothetical protein